MFRLLITTSLFITLTGCTWLGSTRAPVERQAMTLSGSPVLLSPHECAESLLTSQGQGYPALSANNIELFNWNMQKNPGNAMRADMARHGKGADLILLQEARATTRGAESMQANYHWAFAPGYQTEQVNSGVMTASRVAPLVQCTFTNVEPWLRSPKATNVTEYALADSDETLLVVNVHLINFTFGTKAMLAQLNEALGVIGFHQGPVIVSGDFNTWSESRSEAVTAAMEAHSLRPVEFDTDLRKRAFGYALDHVYVRGLRATESDSYNVDSSDHNPMSMVFELVDEIFAASESNVDRS